MKVIIGSALALLCMAVHFQDGMKMQFKQAWTFLEVFICANKFYVFSMVTSLFSSKLCRSNCALLCDPSLLMMRAKDKKS